MTTDVTESQQIARAASRQLRRAARHGMALTVKVESMREPMVLPVEAVAALQDALDDLAAGVTAEAASDEMTTQDLADLLNVSRPYIVSLLEKGEIPFRKVGTKRRVLHIDALRYKQLDDERRYVAMRELTAESDALGLYEPARGSWTRRTARVHDHPLGSLGEAAGTDASLVGDRDGRQK